MNPAPEPRALDMRSRAVKAPMPDLITEHTELPCGTLLIAMVGIIRSALTTVVTGEPHFRARPCFLWTGAHRDFVQRGPLH